MTRANDIKVGDTIKCKDWKDLKKTAFYLSSLGYGCCVVGFEQMSSDTLTITALPEGKDGERRDN